MGLVDKLTELDEKIWKQYEKVTNYCNKEYGWNKYDLATRSALGSSISMLGAGVYMLIDGFQTSNMVYTTIGITASLLAIPFYHVRKKSYGRQEAAEIKLLENGGALVSPTSKPYRPFNFGFAAFFFSSAELRMLGDFPQSNEEQNTLMMCVGLAWGCYYVCYPSESYFKDQIMTPPKKKKSVLKTLYQKVTGKIQPAPQPQLEPTKYQSIDDVVGGA